MLPPLELITEPVFSRIAPPTPALSISALRVTLRRPEVEVISAPLRKIILLFASKVRSASPPEIFSILLSTKIFPGWLFAPDEPVVTVTFVPPLRDVSMLAGVRMASLSVVVKLGLPLILVSVPS